MWGILMTPPVYSKMYNSFAMMLRRRSIPRGQTSEQGKFKLVGWTEFEAVMGPSPLITHRRELLARARTERIKRACAKLEKLVLASLGEPFEALAKPFRDRTRERGAMAEEDRQSKRMRTEQT